MRAFEGQHSDNVAIKRTREQKQLLLRQLREQLGALKPTVTEAVRTAMVKRIADLEQELQAPPAGKDKPGSGRPGPSQDRSAAPRRRP